MFRVGFAALAVWVAVTETWDVNGSGHISIHEMLLFFVRLLAFPLHILLSLAPASALNALRLPDAYWPSSAVVAVVLSLPLWGILLIGGLLVEAWLERASHARKTRGGGSDPTVTDRAASNGTASTHYPNRQLGSNGKWRNL
jgi:hypothetical protein